LAIIRRKITKKQEKNINIVKSLNQHIPKRLQDELLTLENLSCKETIINFITEYQSIEFDNIHEESQFILPLLETLSLILVGPEFQGVFRKHMVLSLAQIEFDEKVKERFIHPVQNFLIGALIIDKFYPFFSEWIINVPEDPYYKIETGWFLTSIYHDVYRTTLFAIGDEEDQEDPSSTLHIFNEEKYILKMASLYEHLTNDDELSTWNPMIDVPNELLIKILHSYSTSNNHGVKSTLMFLRDLEKAIEQKVYHPIFFLSAFSIAIHHNIVYKQLLENGLMPLNITKFPFACVLLYCDAIHEWNRESIVKGAPELIDIKIQDNLVYFDISYERSRDITLKLPEIDSIKECISSEPYITFEYGARLKASK